MSRMIQVGRLPALVDDADYEALSRHMWRLHSTGNYAERGGGSTKVLMHREVICAKPGEYVDHINGNGLDNRRENLRICTHQQNLRHRVSPPVGVSRFRGVSLDKRKGRKKKWRAHITVDGRQRSLGYYELEVGAAMAYDAAALKLFGEFASPNFTQPPTLC